MIDPVTAIVGGLTLLARLTDTLTAAKARREQGLDLTPEQREALDQVNALKANRIVDKIDQRIGPDNAGG